jgi:hypothetical protein
MRRRTKMTEIKKTESAVKPVATIKTPAVTPEVKAPVAAAKAEVKAEVKKEVVKKAPVKKAAAKKPAAKTEAKKAEPKKVAKPAVKEEAPKKAAAKKPAAKKPATKKVAAKKTEAKEADVNVKVELQYSYKHVTYDELVQNSKNHFQFEMGGNVDEIKTLSIYVKPAEDAAYYVVNDKVQGRIGL